MKMDFTDWIYEISIGLLFTAVGITDSFFAGFIFGMCGYFLLHQYIKKRLND